MSQDPNVIVQNQNQTTITTDSNVVTDATTQTTAAVTDTPVVDSSSSGDNVDGTTDQTTDSDTQSDTTDQGYVLGEAIFKQQPSKVISNGIVGFQIEKVEIEINVNNYFGDMKW